LRKAINFHAAASNILAPSISCSGVKISPHLFFSKTQALLQVSASLLAPRLADVEAERYKSFLKFERELFMKLMPVFHPRPAVPASLNLLLR